MIASLNDTIKSCIQTSRALKFDNVMWKSVSEYGHLTASNAKDIGLINSLPSVSPLSFMMKANKRVKEKAKLEDKFGIEIASNTFNGTDGLSVATYKRMLDRRSKLEKLDSKLNRNLQRLSELSTATSLLLSGLGIQPSKSSKEDKIAVVTVNGGIDTSVSYRVIESIRKIRDDKKVKCLVLRVNSPGGSVVSSEAILEELKTLDVVSADFINMILLWNIRLTLTLVTTDFVVYCTACSVLNGKLRRQRRLLHRHQLQTNIRPAHHSHWLHRCISSKVRCNQLGQELWNP